MQVITYRTFGGMWVLATMIFVNGCMKDDTEHTRNFDVQILQTVPNLVEIAILGSGPAGLTSAIYGARANRHTVVFHGDKPGGLLTETTEVENWPGHQSVMGPNLIENMQKQAEHLGAIFVNDTIKKVDFSKFPFVLQTEDGVIIHALSVIISTGASPRILQIPGEQEYWGKGVTTCAVCDAPFYKGEDVIVIGGGDSAVEEAMQLAPYAKHITIMVRKGAMRAAASMQDLLNGYENISVVYHRELQEVLGNGEYVTGVTILNNETDEQYHMPIKGVFLAIGHIPNTTIFNKQIAIDPNGYVSLQGRTQKTTVNGVFAAGDVEDHRYRQAIHASGNGCAASLDADKFLNDGGLSPQMSAQLEDQFFFPQSARVAVLPQLVSFADFEQLTAHFSGPIILDFYTEQCPSCKQMMPAMEAVAAQYVGKALFFKINADQAQDLAEAFKIISVPTVVVLKNGSEIIRYADLMSKSEIRKALKLAYQ